MKTLTQRGIYILVNLRYVRLKLLKHKEDNKKIIDTLDHNFKNMHDIIMSWALFETYYFLDDALTFVKNGA